MTQVKSSLKATWLKNILRFIGILILVILVTIFLGYIAVTFFPGVNIQQWFKETRLVWFTVRIVIYGVIGGLIYGIHRYQPVSRKAIGLLVLAIGCFETLNLLYVFG